MFRRVHPNLWNVLIVSELEGMDECEGIYKSAIQVHLYCPEAFWQEQAYLLLETYYSHSDTIYDDFTAYVKAEGNGINSL